MHELFYDLATKSIRRFERRNPLLVSMTKMRNKLWGNHQILGSMQSFITLTVSDLHYDAFATHPEKGLSYQLTRFFDKLKRRWPDLAYVKRLEYGLRKTRRLHVHVLLNRDIRDLYRKRSGQFPSCSSVNQLIKLPRIIKGKKYPALWPFGRVHLEVMTRSKDKIANYIMKYVSKTKQQETDEPSVRKDGQAWAKMRFFTTSRNFVPFRDTAWYYHKKIHYRFKSAFILPNLSHPDLIDEPYGLMRQKIYMQYQQTEYDIVSIDDSVESRRVKRMKRRQAHEEHMMHILHNDYEIVNLKRNNRRSLLAQFNEREHKHIQVFLPPSLKSPSDFVIRKYLLWQYDLFQKSQSNINIKPKVFKQLTVATLQKSCKKLSPIWANELPSILATEWVASQTKNYSQNYSQKNSPKEFPNEFPMLIGKRNWLQLWLNVLNMLDGSALEHIL